MAPINRDYSILLVKVCLLAYWIFMLQVYRKCHHPALITASTLEVQIGVCALSHVAGDNH